LAKHILSDPNLAGKTVVICWVHDYLPALAKAFGVKPEPARWKGTAIPRSDSNPTSLRRNLQIMDNIQNVTIEDAPADKFPICPYCKRELQTIWEKTSGLGIRGPKEILMCPSAPSEWQL
jgi:hypothetical protein